MSLGLVETLEQTKFVKKLIENVKAWPLNIYQIQCFHATKKPHLIRNILHVTLLWPFVIIQST